MGLLKAKINIGYLLIALYVIFCLVVFLSIFIADKVDIEIITFIATLFSYIVIPIFIIVGSFIPGDLLLQAFGGSVVILIALIAIVAVSNKMRRRDTI